MKKMCVYKLKLKVLVSKYFNSSIYLHLSTVIMTLSCIVSLDLHIVQNEVKL